jgi:transcription antitermination factor NusG
MKKNWYAVYTRPKSEKKVSAMLTKKKIENYCPLNKVLLTSNFQKPKSVVEPLFNNYVFVNTTEENMKTVLSQSDVINFVYWLGRPVVIKDNEIEAIQRFVDCYSNVWLEKTQVNTQSMVRVVNKVPMVCDENNVITLHNTQIKITIPSLGYALNANSAHDEFEIFEEANEMNVLVS